LAPPSRVIPPLSPVNTIEVPIEDATASAAILNVTADATAHEFPSYVQSYVCGSAPPESQSPSVTEFLPKVRSSREIVVPATGGRACLRLWSRGPAQTNLPSLLVDRLGSFGANGNLEYIPVDPSRLLDARPAPIAVTPTPIGINTAPIPADAAAIVGVASMFGSADGFLKIAALNAFGVDTSTLSFQNPNLAMVQVTSGVAGGLGVSGEHFNKTALAAGLILDIMGYYRKVR
jgi:hypothetical protein